MSRIFILLLLLAILYGLYVYQQKSSNNKPDKKMKKIKKMKEEVDLDNISQISFDTAKNEPSYGGDLKSLEESDNNDDSDEEIYKKDPMIDSVDENASLFNPDREVNY